MINILSRSSSPRESIKTPPNRSSKPSIEKRNKTGKDTVVLEEIQAEINTLNRTKLIYNLSVLLK